MKNYNHISAALALLAIGASASAGTLSGATTTLNGVSTTTNPPKITAAMPIIQVKHSFGVMYYGPDKNPNFACNAKLEYSDGTPPEMVTIKYPAEGVARMRQYTKAGKYTASLTGVANGAIVGCLGSADTSLTIEGPPAPPPPPAAPTPKPGSQAGLAVMPAPQAQLAQAMAPITLKAKVKSVTIKGGNTFSPGTVPLYSTIVLDKPEANCALNFSVATLNEGSDTINVQLMSLNTGGNFANSPSSEFNPGTLDFPNTGKFRVTVRARTDTETHCTGVATADFEIKRQKIFTTGAPAPAPVYGSFISKITAVEHADSWDITVLGAGDKSCKYHVRTWTLPNMSIFGEQAMVYEKGVTAPGKGFMKVNKQDGKKVLVETIADASDQVDNQSCLGTPKLELTPTPPPPAPVLPKKGTVLGLSVAKAVYAPGEPIPGTLKVSGDNCSFVFRVRKLPFVNLSDDVVFAVKTQSLVWDLNNLGQTLPEGKWTVISQPGNEALAPGEIRCEIGAGGGVGQAFFTVGQ